MGYRLEAISNEPEEIVKVRPGGEETKYYAWPTLSAEQALAILRSELPDVEALDNYAQWLADALKDRHPEMDKAAVLALFTPSEIFELMGHFLSLSGRPHSSREVKAMTDSIMTSKPPSDE